ncbi:MAG TPA: amino acid ABC transporter ATP-binding protein [Candidatus Baltobacteraceae bacterium]
MSLIQVEDVEKRFDANVVLRGVSLQVERGEVLVVIGPSGGGKSTLLRCINLLEPIQRGRIIVDGQVITDPGVNVNAVRRQVGMVFQHFNLFPHLRVIDNLTLAPTQALHQQKSEASQRGRALLERVGLRDKADSYPHQLSGGQQQRVAIARALMMDPRVMLFDEVTSALDPELVGDVLEVMRDLAESGMTMIVVTHEMQFAREVGDRLVLIAEGVVVEEGKPREMLDRPQHERTRQFLRRLLRFHDAEGAPVSQGGT